MAQAPEAMRWVSCRGGSKPAKFVDALFAGWSEDGGMYMPSSVPCVSAAELRSWAGLSYPDVCERVLSLYDLLYDVAAA